MRIKKYIPLIIAALMAGCSDSKSPEQAEAPDSAIAAVNSNERPAAVPASEKEWADLQGFTKTLWTTTLSRERAHDKLVRSQQTAMASKDMGMFVSSMTEYRRQVAKTGDVLAKLKAPNVSDKDSTTYLERSFRAFKEGNELELEKTDLLIKGIRTGVMTSDEDMERRNRDINLKTSIGVRNLQRVFWNYGYESADLSEETMTVLPGVKPRVTTDFNRGES